MRLASTLALAAAAASAVSQETFPGAKADALRSAAADGGTAGAGLMPLVQMAIVAGLILVFLKVWLPKVLGKVNKKITTRVDGGIRIEEAATFAGGTLYLATVKRRTLLLCAGSTGVSCLADLTEAQAADRAEPAFFELLDDESKRQSASAEAKAPFKTESDPSADSFRFDEVEALLDRAKRLVA